MGEMRKQGARIKQVEGTLFACSRFAELGTKSIDDNLEQRNKLSVAVQKAAHDLFFVQMQIPKTRAIENQTGITLRKHPISEITVLNEKLRFRGHRKLRVPTKHGGEQGSPRTGMPNHENRFF
jgi:hypothetical protein